MFQVMSSSSVLLCINCNAKLNCSHSAESNNDDSLEVTLVLSILFSGNENANEITDFEESRIEHVNRILFTRFCDSCITVLKKLILCRQKFLNNTQVDSEIRKIIEPRKSEVKPNNVLSECILPDNDFNNDSTLHTRYRVVASNFPMLQYEELFVRLEIVKLEEKLSNPMENTVTRGDNQCIKCYRKFSDSQQCENHLNCTHLLNKEKYSCAHCSKKFSLQWFLIRHFETCHNGIEIFYSCQFCKQKFYSEQDLEKHNFVTHGIRKHAMICIHCEESFPAISLLRKHLIAAHQGTLEADAAVANMLTSGKEKEKKCSLCETVLENKFFEWAKHMSSSHPEATPVCSICDAPQSSYKKLSIHENTHKTVECNQCEEIFTSIPKLHKHQNGVHKRTTGKCVCEICGRHYENYWKLTKHYTLHSNKWNPRKHSCNICSDRSFNTRTGLVSHMKTVHSKVKTRFECAICDQFFTETWKLHEHQEKVHSKKTAYPCKICGKLFTELKSVTSHFSVHIAATSNRVEVTGCFSADAAGYVCPTCGKTSGWKTHFIRHLRRMHSLVGYTNPDANAAIEATMKCPHCPKMFPRRDMMLRHVRHYHTVTSSQSTPRYSARWCPICSKQIVRLDIMKGHIKRHFVYVKTKADLESGEKGRNLNDFYCEINRVLQCSFCMRKSGFNQRNFIEHLRKKHKCSIFIDEDEQRKHLVGKDSPIGNNSTFECSHSKCQKRFFTRNELRRHERTVHKKLNIKNVKIGKQF